MRRSHRNYAHLVERAEFAWAQAAKIHPEGLPGLLQQVIELYLRAADYGQPEERHHARARAGQAAGQLALVLARPEPRRGRLQIAT